MKPLVLIVCTALVSVATPASAAEPLSAPERDKQLMLYFAKSFGSTQRQNRMPFTYGLKLQQSSPLDFRRTIDVVHLRLSGAGRSSLLLAGTLSFDSTGESSQDSSDDSSNVAWSMKHKGMTITLVGLGLIGLACLAKWQICESSDGYEQTSTDTTDSR